MVPNEGQLLARALNRYERSRFKLAVLAAMPSLLLPAIAFTVGGRLAFSATLGVGIWGAVVLLAWRGREWGMSVPLGLLAGAVPLSLALLAQTIGHVCTPQGCTTFCVPMCAAGGAIAGLVIAAAARRSPAPLVTLGCGAALSLAVGSMGCACVGAAGMLGMGAGLVASMGVAVAAHRHAH